MTKKKSSRWILEASRPSIKVITHSFPREEDCSSLIPLFSTILILKPTFSFSLVHVALLSPPISLNPWLIWGISAFSPVPTVKLGAGVVLLTELLGKGNGWSVLCSLWSFFFVHFDLIRIVSWVSCFRSLWKTTYGPDLNLQLSFVLSLKYVLSSYHVIKSNLFNFLNEVQILSSSIFKYGGSNYNKLFFKII